METLNYDEIKELYENEKNDKEMYRQALFELYQTASYMLSKEKSLEPEVITKQLEIIKNILGSRRGFDD